MGMDEFWRTTPALLHELMQAAIEWRNPKKAQREVIRVEYADQCGW